MMKKSFKYINRSKSLLTDKTNLESLYTLKNCPVFMGCTEDSPKNDLFAEMKWEICKDTGCIQLAKLLPLDILYLYQHNDGTGSIWTEHYLSFSKFLQKFHPKHILEIGGANDIIAKDYIKVIKDAHWTVIEPHPLFTPSSRIKVIKGWFNKDFSYDGKVDVVVHSHVLEHLYDPLEFITQLNRFLKIGDKHIFTFPNLLELLKNKITSSLNFEHTIFLTEYIVDQILKSSGFKILKKQYFKDHSIFYATEKVSEKIKLLVFENKYKEYKKLFMDFINYHLEMIDDINKKIKKNKLPLYLFGAHIFSQYLLLFGLESDKIISILDNSPLKQKKRLYGTKFMVESPKVLIDKGPAVVILKAGIYNEEIKKDILENINPEVIFW